MRAHLVGGPAERRWAQHTQNPVASICGPVSSERACFPPCASLGQCQTVCQTLVACAAHRSVLGKPFIRKTALDEVKMLNHITDLLAALGDVFSSAHVLPPQLVTSAAQVRSTARTAQPLARGCHRTGLIAAC
jgi:hypothetical protein